MLTRGSDDAHRGTDAVAIALHAHRVNGQPAAASRAIAENAGRAIVGRHHNVHGAVVVEITKGGSSAGHGVPERRHVDEFTRAIPQQQWCFEIANAGLCQLDVVHHVPLRDKDILPTVVVKVEEIGAPSGVQFADGREASGCRDILEEPLGITK